MQTRQLVNLGLSGILFLAVAIMAGCSTGKEGATAAAGLDSQHALVRKAALERIAESPDMSAYNDLVATLKNDPDRLVRSQAAFTIGELNKRHYSVGFSPLAEALQNDPSVFVRAASAISLSATSDSRAVEPLIAALRDDRRGEIQMTVESKIVSYKACTADAARTSLERIVGMSFASSAEAADNKRIEIASQWEDWYTPRADFFPAQTAIAKR